MPKDVSASEAKNRLGALINWVVKNQEEVVIKNHGEPSAVIISFEEYQQYQELKEKARRQAILAELHALRDEVGSKNKDLTDEEAFALADRFVREVIDDMVAEGKIVFEPAD